MAKNKTKIIKNSSILFNTLFLSDISREENIYSFSKNEID